MKEKNAVSESKFNKIMERVTDKIDESEHGLEVGLENWRNQMVLLRRAGVADDDLEDMFSELEDYVEDGDRESAEQVSAAMREKVKTELLAR
ncbi:MAG: hypothetical protein ABEJ07_05255 [Candidatus Nanohaloarchaea archaeon]